MEDATKAVTGENERRKPGPKPMAETWAVTSLRLRADQWRWLKTQALARALESGTKADASAIVRELLDKAMKTGA